MAAQAAILVIDDDESIRVGCSQALAEEGCRVQDAPSAERGLDCLRRESFDVVILDLRMPGMNGMEALERIKEHDANAIVVVITVSIISVFIAVVDRIVGFLVSLII